MNARKFEKARAGLLLIASPRFKNLGEGLSRGTYHERKLKEVDEIVASLEDSLDLVQPGIVYSREDMEKAMMLFLNEKVDFIVANFLSWSEDFAWIRFLRDMPEIPILFVNIAKDKVSFEDTLDEDDFIDYLCAGTLVGSLEGSGSVSRINRKDLKVVVGSKAEIHDEILLFAKVAWVRSILRNSTLGLLANYNEAMWSTYMDPYNLFTRIGPELRFITYTTLNDEVNQVPDAEVNAYKAELEAKHPVMEDVDDEKFRAAVRGSLGLARLTERLGVDIMVFNDIDVAMFELIGHRPSFYPEAYERMKSVLVPEADMGAGIITYVLKLISGKRVNFIEPFHIEAEKGAFAAGHAGPNDHTDPDFQKNVIISRDVRFAKTRYKYAGAPFAWYRIPAGRKTMAQLVETNGKYKLVATLVDSLEGKHLFATYSHGIFRPLIPVKELFERILKIGTTQHFALVDGDYLKELSVFAEMTGKCLNYIGMREMELKGVGIAFPGPFNIYQATPLMQHKFNSIYGLDLREYFYQMSGISRDVPIRFMHDANAVLLGEIWKGNAQGYANAAAVTLGTGLGFAVSENGKVLCNEIGGPFLSIFKLPYKDGILEDYTAKRGFVRIYQELSGRMSGEIEVSEIGNRAVHGDEAALQTFLEVGRILSKACVRF